MEEITKLESELYKLFEAKATVEQAIIIKQQELKKLREGKPNA